MIFCLPPLRAGQLEVGVTSGRTADGLGLVWPGVAAAPVNWTWSMYFAEHITSSIVGSSLGFLGSLSMHREGSSARLDGRCGGWHQHGKK